MVSLSEVSGGEQHSSFSSRCDERFVGYGGNKAACLFELYISGVSFYVLVDDFLIHQRFVCLDWPHNALSDGPISHTYAEQVRKQEVLTSAWCLFMELTFYLAKIQRQSIRSVQRRDVPQVSQQILYRRIVGYRSGSQRADRV